LGPFRYSMKLDAKWAKLVQLSKSSCHEFISELFAKNAPDPPPMDPKLMFCCIP